jgi:hypothetical protein
MTSTPLIHFWRRLRDTDPVLTWTGTAMLGVLGLTIVGLLFDPRTIGGAPAWLKPAKFAISTTIYTFTLAWLFGWLTGRERLRRSVSRLTGGVFVLEVGLISLQAARGVTSHFNAATALDQAIYNVMGAAIVLQSLAMIPVVWAVFRQKFDDASIGWAVRLGLLVSVVGAFAGGIMTRPTADQLAAATQHGKMTIAGAHTVGAADGGPGLPVTGWSSQHGDLRVAHFMGLHAMQVLPPIAFLPAVRRRTKEARVRLVKAGAVGYTGLFVVLLWQALRGQSVIAPDSITLLTLGVLAATTVGIARGSARAALIKARAYV